MNKKDIQPIAAASIDTFTAKTNFEWNNSSRPMGWFSNLSDREVGMFASQSNRRLTDSLRWIRLIASPNNGATESTI